MMKKSDAKIIIGVLFVIWSNSETHKILTIVLAGIGFSNMVIAFLYALRDD